MTTVSRYLVPKMDCPAEEQMVRDALDELGGIRKLEFDLPARRLAVYHDSDAAPIAERLDRLNLGAKLESREEAKAAVGGSDIFVSHYLIPKMDCAAEEQMVRDALQDLQGIRKLGFDLAGRRLTVYHEGDHGEITPRLSPLGLGAKLESSEATELVFEDREDADGRERATLQMLLAINAGMFAVEQIAGWLASSAGLLADSLDMLADAAVYGIALYAVGRSKDLKRRAAHVSGWLQLALALGALSEVVRRFVFGSEPEPSYMMVVAFAALVANVSCLVLISRHREGGAHMKASWIFSTNDVIANTGVIVAGGLVAWTGSRLPDLVIGAIIAAVVASGAVRILRLR